MVKRSRSCCMVALMLVFAWITQNAAQEIPKETASPESKTLDSRTKPEVPAPTEESSVTNHKIPIDVTSLAQFINTGLSEAYLKSNEYGKWKVAERKNRKIYSKADSADIKPRTAVSRCSTYIEQ